MKNRIIAGESIISRNSDEYARFDPSEHKNKAISQSPISFAYKKSVANL